MFIPKLTITNTLLKRIARIDAAQEVILNAPLVPAWERKFQQEAVNRSAHHSTKIEGNELSMKDVEKVLTGGRIQTRRIRDIQEVINYRNAIQYISEHFSEAERKMVTEGNLKGVHKALTVDILPENWRGRYRDKKAMEVDVVSGKTVFEAMSPAKLEKALHGFFFWYNSREGKEWHPVIRAGILHYQITYIHPFVEANGRTARTMATLSLYNDGYDIKRFFSLDEYYDQDIEQYYRFLQTADKTGDVTEWLEYFSDGLGEELNRIKERIVALSRDRAFKDRVGGQIALSERQIDIIKFVEKVGYFQNKDFKALYPDLSDDTILRELKPLIEKKLIKKQGKTRGARYVLT